MMKLSFFLGLLVHTALVPIVFLVVLFVMILFPFGSTKAGRGLTGTYNTRPIFGSETRERFPPLSESATKRSAQTSKRRCA